MSQPVSRATKWIYSSGDISFSLTIKSVLVLPVYWNLGAGVLLFDEMIHRVQGKGYEWSELPLTSTDNAATPSLAERMGAWIYKRYRFTVRNFD